MTDSESTNTENDLAGPNRVQPDVLLTDLPTEIILKILEYLDPFFLHKVVSRTCKKLNSILFCNYLWKRAFHTKNDLAIAATYPYIEHLGLNTERWRSGRDISWRDLTVSTESAKIRWFNPRRVFSFGETTINVVHVLKGGWCMAGSRERSINIWDIPNQRHTRYIHNAHNGWLSGLGTLLDHDSIVSCGWDSYVKIWNFSERMEPLNAFCLNMAVMDMDTQPQMIAACTFPELVLIDPRIGRPHGISRYPIDEGSVVQVKFSGSSVIMASRIKSLMEFDLRMNRMRLKQDIMTESTPRAMSILDGIVYVGDNYGYAYMFDLHNDFRKIDTFDMCPSRAQIRVLIPRKGYMIVGSSDGELKAVLSVKGPNGIRILKSVSFKGEVSGGHFFDDTLAILDGTAGSVTIYSPFV